MTLDFFLINGLELKNSYIKEQIRSKVIFSL